MSEKEEEQRKRTRKDCGLGRRKVRRWRGRLEWKGGMLEEVMRWREGGMEAGVCEAGKEGRDVRRKALEVGMERRDDGIGRDQGKERRIGWRI